MSTVTFEDCKCDRDTPQAILVSGIESHEIWIPKSQVDDDSEVYQSGTEGKLIISEWIAEKKGLI